MNCATFCRRLLGLTRKESPAVPRILWLDTSRIRPRDDLYAWVYFEGVAEPIEVSACCRYAARSKAIDTMVERRAADTIANVIKAGWALIDATQEEIEAAELADDVYHPLYEPREKLKRTIEALDTDRSPA